MMDKVINLLKEGNINIPKILFLNYKNLDLTEKELIVISYIINSTSIFNPKKIADDLNYDLSEVLEIIDSLTSKDFIKIEIKKNGNIREEYINIDSLYNKLSYLVVNEEETKSSNIFDIFEKEMGRTLSPMEYEIINAWLDNSFSEELIILALKEATYNGVSNLRYIDKILYEWNKKGIKNKEDVEKDRKKFENKKIESKELFDYDWLNDNE